MVDKTEFDIMDADHESRLNDLEDEEPYCIECGEDEELAFMGNYANGGQYECQCCGHRFMWPD